MLIRHEIKKSSMLKKKIFFLTAREWLRSLRVNRVDCFSSIVEDSDVEKN